MLIGVLWALASCDGDGGGATDDTAGADDSATNPKVNHDACDAYLECLEVVAPAQVGPALESYGTEGACWDSKENATLCNDACTTLMEKLAKAFPDVPECSGGETSTPYPRALRVEWHTNGVDVEVVGGTGSLKFGITQSGADPWIAEDCHHELAGYGPFCHEVEADDSTSIPCVSSLNDVDDGHTLFCDFIESRGGDDSTLTYYLATEDDSWCAVAGADKEWFAHLDCENWN